MRVTVSLGMTCVTEDGLGDGLPELETILGQADQALYRSKSSGRNQVNLNGCDDAGGAVPGQTLDGAVWPGS
ncbi:MAG: GGDEF domain-containing protein [Chloroflexota bacterium]